MYLPKQFEETSRSVMFDLIRAHPLATVVPRAVDGLNANHIPLLPGKASDGRDVLRGHVARTNPILDDLIVSSEALEQAGTESAHIIRDWVKRHL